MAEEGEFPSAIPFEPGTIIGVRVTVVHTDPRGRESVASVVMNVIAGTTVDQINAAALNWFEGGFAGAHTGNASPGTYGQPQIIQVVEGGLPGAVTGIAGPA